MQQASSGEAEEEQEIEQRAAGGQELGWEEQREILGPAFDHLGVGDVHAGGERFGGVAEADGVWRA